MPRFKSCLGSLSLMVMLTIGCAAKVEESPVSSSPSNPSSDGAAPEIQEPVFEDGFESGKAEKWTGEPADDDQQTESDDEAEGEGEG